LLKPTATKTLSASTHSRRANQLNTKKFTTGASEEFAASWKHGSAFYAQPSLPDEDGVRKVRRVKLDGVTVAEATDEMRHVVIDHNNDREYALDRKTDRMLNPESGHINFWKKQFSGTRLTRSHLI
jgi:hypothetical protein|tara:strand:- start:202 stop:579 length:378 start_codon:yes stop_codon:yes gene_type:complete